MGLFSAIGSAIGGSVGGPIGASIGGAIGQGIEARGAQKGAESASRGAAQARDLALESSQERVDVAREFLQDWEAIYGGIEDNLSSFFASMTPERFTALGLENLQKEFQTTKTRVRETFAQRGLKDSGLELSLDTLLEAERAGARAEIRSEAPFKVAEAQSKFLALGLTQKPSIQAGLTGALQARTNILQDFATGATRAAETAAQGAGALEGEFAASVGSVLDDILNPEEEEADTVN